MENGQTYQGVVVTGRGAGAAMMSASGLLEQARQWTGLSVIPGTLNVVLNRALDVSSAGYLSLTEAGLEFDLAAVGIEHQGEQGFHFWRVAVADQYPAFAVCFTWVGSPYTKVELISDRHLRNTLGLKDGDSIEFTVVDESMNESKPTREKGPMIARGRTAEIFAWKDNQVLKLFLDWCPAHWAQGEALITQAVHQAGLPVPAVEGTVEVDGRYGIIFERVEGPSLLAELTTKPWKFVKLARMLAELQAAMHSRELPGLPSQREILQYDIRAAATLPTHLKEAALQALAELPDGRAVCHGDFHPDNIIMSSKGPIVIDWPTAKQGNPLADVARTRLILRVGAPPGAGAVLRRLANLGGSLLYSIYLKRYLRLRPASRQQIDAWQLPVMAARLSENIPEENERLLALIEASLPPQG